MCPFYNEITFTSNYIRVLIHSLGLFLNKATKNGQKDYDLQQNSTKKANCEKFYICERKTKIFFLK